MSREEVPHRGRQRDGVLARGPGDDAVLADRNIAACAGCHSPNGAGIPAQYPRLSGQHADYTASQLVSFRDGVRKNSLQMSQVAAKLNDREIRAVADYIAGLR